jgi:hypothetical protein
MSSRLSSVFPRPSAADADDVVWTLQTAAVQWQRGLRADAIVWVRKAADTATQLGHSPRAEELRSHAARLAEFLWSDPEETLQDAPIVPPAPRRSSGRRITIEDAEEIMELEELDAEELEFTENDLPTPDDAVSDISDEDLTYYREGGEGSEPTHVLPDDLDLRSDSESPSPRESFLSVSPESDEESDSYISISPDDESARAEAGAEMEQASNHATNGAGSYLPGPPTEGPARPRAERPATRTRGGRSEPLDGVKSPTLPSPTYGSAARTKAANGESLAMRSSLEPAPPGPTLEELARLLAPHSPMAKGLGAPPPSPPQPVASPLPAAHVEEGQPPSVDGLDFESVEALADLPEEAQAELASSGELLTLTSGQEVVLREGAALITRGSVHVTLTYSDVSAARVGAGAVVAARGSIEAGPLRLIADSAQTHIVIWTEDKMTAAMRDCPWVVDDLRLLADRFQAHASAGLGPLGERLDDALRAAVYERLQVRVLSPDESVAERGKPLKGLFVVAVGELNVSGVAHKPLRAGEFLFPSCVIGAEPAPHDVKAGPKGGLVLFATRPVAHELMMSVPPLLEILAS